jgi:hypothetical protein
MMSKSPEQIYLKHVATILKKTGHPKQGEVLDDLRSHISDLLENENTPMTIDDLKERLGSPEEYAESLLPAKGHEVTVARRRKKTLITGVVLIVIILTSIAVLSNRHVLAAKYRHALGKNYVANPFFDLNRMKQLKVGASADEIRDAIGYPLHRTMYDKGIYFGSTEKSDREQEDDIHWIYTQYPAKDAPFYTKACAIMDPEGLKLVRVHIDEHHPIASNATTNHNPHSMYVGAMHTLDWTGSKYIVDKKFVVPTDDKVFVLHAPKFVQSARDLSAEAFQKRQSQVTQHWRNIDEDQYRILYSFLPTNSMPHEEFHRLFKGHPQENHIHSMYQFQETIYHQMRVGPTHEDKIFLYHRGTLYYYPYVVSGYPGIERAFQKDQNWLIHRLLSGAEE